MKKLVSLGVLLVLLSAAVFAEGDSGWSVSFLAQLTKDLLYVTKTSGEIKTTQTNQTGTSIKLGDEIEGSSNFFSTYKGRDDHDNRYLVGLTHAGDFHKVYIDMKVDNNWANGVKFWDIINGDAADWEFSGNTGALGSQFVLDGKVGTGRYGGFVGANEIWDDYIGAGGMNFFGVQTGTGLGNLMISDNISAAGLDGNPWQAVYAIGATFAGNFRFAVGSTLSEDGFKDGLLSKSSINAAFMLSAKNLANIISFDLFYAVRGKDENTLQRGQYNPIYAYQYEGASWSNVLGAYVGLSIVDNLTLAVGYTGYFQVYERGELEDGVDQNTNIAYKDFAYTTPYYSGVDIKLGYSGIDKLGISFNNNLSFSAVTGAGDRESPDYGKTLSRVIGVTGKRLADGEKDGWFSWGTRLRVGYALTDNLTVGLSLANQLSVQTYDEDYNWNNGNLDKTKYSLTTDDFVVSVNADYAVGNVKFGIGLDLGATGYTLDNKTDFTPNGGTTTTSTAKGGFTNVRFGIPVVFKVAF